MIMTSTSPQWFAATVKPQHEAAVAVAFEQRGFEPFSPTYEVRSQWSDRKRTIHRPLFPGYVFCHFSRSAKAAVAKTPGVTSIVGFGGIAVPVPDEEVARVKTMIASGLPVQPWPYLEEGDPVRIEKGPLRGLEGIVVSHENDYRLVVNVTFLQRSVSVSVDRAALGTASTQRAYV
jgi:transcription antitermination factor NusG